MNDGKRVDPPPPPPYDWVMGTPVTPADDQHAVPINYVAPPATNYRPPNSYPAYPFYSTSASSAPAGGGPPSSYATGGSGHGGPAAPYSSSGTSGNPYVNVSPITTGSPPSKSPMDTILKVLGRCGKKLEDNTRKATEVAGNVWNHLKTSPNITDAAMARLTQGTKVFAEGGIDKVFQQTFGIFPGEQLRKAYACYISTSSGPVIGTLYLSTARIAFCSDNPLYHNISQGQQEWIYYKVVMSLDQLKAINPSANSRNPGERYIQIVTADKHEFWFMGFVSYDKALGNLKEAAQKFAGHRLYQQK